MCQVYNQVGCLTSLMRYFRENGIDDFTTVQEVLDFKQSYAAEKAKLITLHEHAIREEQTRLEAALLSLDSTKHTLRVQWEQDRTARRSKLQQRLDQCRHTKAGLLQQWYLKRCMDGQQLGYMLRIGSMWTVTAIRRSLKNRRHRFIVGNFNEAVARRCKKPLRRLELKKALVDEAASVIYGAIGEQKVVSELQQLPDDYILINDFSVRFTEPVYYRQEGQYVGSIQVDHLLIGPSGVFVLETKNWSEQSLSDSSLRSPVEQIRRSGFALYQLLTKGTEGERLRLHGHHWGDKKVPLRNLIVMTGTKPTEEFQWVKVLRLQEVRGYVQYFRPVFSSEETEEIADYLLHISAMKKVKLRGR